jgi:hypothetical protein
MDVNRGSYRRRDESVLGRYVYSIVMTLKDYIYLALPLTNHKIEQLWSTSIHPENNEQATRI